MDVWFFFLSVLCSNLIFHALFFLYSYFFHVILYFFDCLFCTHIIDYWKVVHTLPTHAMHCILCFLFNYVRVLSVIFFSYYFFPSIWVLLHVQLTWFMLCFFFSLLFISCLHSLLWMKSMKKNVYHQKLEYSSCSLTHNTVESKKYIYLTNKLCLE